MLAIVLAAVLGILTWTLLEYVIHRWMGHDRRFKRTPFGVEHVRHHAQGNYFAPTWKKLVFATLFAAAVTPAACGIAGVEAGLAYVVGLVGFYGVYEWLHRREHTHAGWGPYGRWARRHHFHHHFVDGRANHGVTSPIWDVVFRTYQQPAASIAVPRKLVMPWLVDATNASAGQPASIAIRPEHAVRFSLR